MDRLLLARRVIAPPGETSSAVRYETGLSPAWIHRSARAGEPRCAYSEIPTVSVICGGPAESRRFYLDYLGLATGTDAEVAGDLRDVVATLTGVPQGTRAHLRSYREQGEPSGKYLLVNFFDASTLRLAHRQQPGLLGIALYTHEVAAVETWIERAAVRGTVVVAGPWPSSTSTDRVGCCSCAGPTTS